MWLVIYNFEKWIQIYEKNIDDCEKGESKGGYDSIDLSSIFKKGNSELDKFLSQAEDDSKRCNRKPMLCWKKTRKPWLSFLKTSDLEGHDFKYKLIYGKWTGISLDLLLELEDKFFLLS